MNLTKKLGPLPVWAWGIILGVGGYFLYSRYKANASSSTSSTSPTATVLDPNSIDPNTGLTYGQEESAALNANAASLGGTSGTAPVDTGIGTSAGTSSELQDFESFLSTLQSSGLLQSASTPVPSSNASTGAAAAAGSPPVIGSSPPTSSASTHTNSTLAGVGSALAHGKAPWTSSSFFKLTLGQVTMLFQSPEATARYLYAKGYRPQGLKGTPNFANATGQTYVYVGPKGKNQLPKLKYTISKAGA